MHRRNFLGSLALSVPSALGALAAGAQAKEAGAQAKEAEAQAKVAFNHSGLAPAEYRRRWQAGLGHSQQGVWLYQPAGSTDPFLAWYPGDEHVTAWAVDTSSLADRNDPTLRSFLHEAALRGKQVRFLG